MATNVRLTAQQALGLVTELQERLQQEHDRIGTLIPTEQTKAAQSDHLCCEIDLLTDLQEKVRAAVLGQPANVIDGLDDQGAEEIQGRLLATAQIFDKIESEGLLALSIADITQEVLDLDSQSGAASQAASLLNRVQQLTPPGSTPNQGAREAIESLKSSLQALQATQNGNGTRQTPRQTNLAVDRTQQPPTPAPSNNNRNLEAERKLKQAQDEEAQCSLFSDQFKDIQETLGSDPLKNFNIVLAHYTTVRKYLLTIDTFASDKAFELFKNIKHETLLEKYITEQAAKEVPAPAPQAPSQQNQTGSLNDLKAALDTYIKDANVKNIKQVKDKYDGLTASYQKKVYDALNEILKAEKKPPVPAAFLRKQNLQLWPGSSTYKLRAVEKVIGDPSLAPATPAPAAPAAPKKADEMRKRFTEVKNMPPVQTSRSNSSLSNLGLTPEEYQWIQGDQGNEQVNRNGNASAPNVLPQMATAISLQQCLQLLGPQASAFEIRQATTNLGILIAEHKKAVFKMSGQEEREIGDRPWFHMYFIHKNEIPEKLKEDIEYGSKAFAGAYEGTNEERVRCVQRTLVELALANIEEAINFDNGELLVQSLNLLEEVKLNEKDRAEGNENAAHNLFGVFYRLHCSAREGNQSLIDPSHSKFQNDFGRIAFRGSYDGVDPAIKLQTVDQVRDALKAAWKL